MSDEEAGLRAAFMPLDAVAAEREERADRLRALIRERRLPAPAHVLADGTELVALDWLALVDEAGGVDRLRRLFEARYVIAADTYGAVAGPDELDDAWDDYLDGTAAARLVEATPENIVREQRLAAAVGRLLEAPAPDDPRWCDRLRGRVEHLAALTRPVSPALHARCGDELARERYVDEPRRLFAAVFD